MIAACREKINSIQQRSLIPMKNVLALVLALTMVLGMGSVALAEGNAQVF